MDEAVGATVTAVGQLSQLGVAGLCLAALLFTYLRTIPQMQKRHEEERVAWREEEKRLLGQLGRRGREVRTLYRARMPDDEISKIERCEAALEASKHNGEGM